MNKLLPFVLVSLFVFCACDNSSSYELKKNQIDLTEEETDDADEGEKLHAHLPIKPNTVIVTAYAEHRLITLYKEKVSKDGKRRYIDGNYHYHKYNYFEDPCNVQNGHYMPGLEAVYGYKMFNISHYNSTTKKKNSLFPHPVLIKTLYYPAAEQDTLKCKPVKRNYYLVSVYDEDTNQDSVINRHDLRRLYAFDIEGKNKRMLIPENYSVMKSEYDDINDDMFVFAQLDKNGNGKREPEETVHVFSVDLEDPSKVEMLY